MQFRVEKSDGSNEIYLHTKVIGSIGAALAEAGFFDVGVAEQLAEAVTTFLRRRHGCHSVVSTDEIHSMIEAALSDTGYEGAALCLHTHRINRQTQRARVEVTRRVVDDGLDNDRCGLCMDESLICEPWNKSVIVCDLLCRGELPSEIARAVASGVEEKVLKLGCRSVTSTLVRELVANEVLATRRAQEALEKDVAKSNNASNIEWEAAPMAAAM